MPFWISRLVVDDVGAHLQVLGDREAGEDAPAFGHQAQAGLVHDVRGQVADVLAFQQHLALAGVQQAGDGAQGGGLAGAVGADEGDDLALLDREGDAHQGMDVAVVGVDVFQFEQAHGCLLTPTGRGAGGALAKVGFDDLRVRGDLRGQALGDLLAVVHHVDVLGNVHDHLHVVLDQQDGDAELVADAPEQQQGVLALGRVHARGRFVQQQQPGLGGQGPGDLHPALGAVGEAAGQFVADPLQAHVFHQFLGPGLGLGLLLPEGPGPEHGLDRVLLEPGVGADHDVLHHGHAAEQADVLEGPGHAQVGDLVGLQALDPLALELDGALLAVVERRRWR